MLQNMQMKKIDKIKVLNIYKLKIYQVLVFMFKIKQDTAPVAFRNHFLELSHRYAAGCSEGNFVGSNFLSNQTNLLIFIELHESRIGFYIKNKKPCYILIALKIQYKNFTSLLRK